MARQTAAERRTAEEAVRVQEAADEILFIKEKAPGLLITLIGRAAQIGIATSIVMGEDGLDVDYVHFVYDGHGPVVDETLFIATSKKWEYDYLDRRFNEIIEARNVQQKRRLDASTLWNGLSEYERGLLKEFCNASKVY